MDEFIWKEYKEEARKKLCGEYLTSRDITSNEDIHNSRLYKFIEKMPKGADLHLHGLTLLPPDILVSFLEEEHDLVINISDSDNKGFIKNKSELNENEKMTIWKY